MNIIYILLNIDYYYYYYYYYQYSISIYIYIYTYIHIYIYTHTHTHIYMRVCVCVCVRVCIGKLELSGKVSPFKVCAFALTSKIVFSGFSKKSPGKLLPLRCTLLFFTIIMQMLLYQNNLILVVIVGLNCLVVIIRSWYSGQLSCEDMCSTTFSWTF